jgi:actin-related protein
MSEFCIQLSTSYFITSLRCGIRCSLLIPSLNSPITAAWQGGQTFTQLPHFGRFAVTKQQYDEFGENLLHRKFSVL